MMIEFDGDLQYCGFQPHLRAQSLALSTIGLAGFALMPERAPPCPESCTYVSAVRVLICIDNF